MGDKSKNKQELIKELASLRKRIKELEQPEFDLRREQEDLQNIENTCRNNFVNSNELIFMSQDGKMVFVHPLTALVTGYSSEELMAKPFIDFIHHDDREMVIDRHYRRMKGEELPRIYSFRMIHKDGNIRWVELDATLTNWQGKPAVLNFLRDITERKQDQDQLRESEERYRTLVEDASDIICRTDVTGRFTFVNRAAVNISGFEEDEMLGKNCRVFIRPDKRNEVIKLLVGQAEKRIEKTYCEFPLLTKEGHEVWIGQNTQLILEDGHVAGFHAVSRDITDRKGVEEALQESESKFRTLFETANDSILLMDQDIIIDCNRKALEVFGCTREQLIGKPPSRFSPEVQPDGRKSLEKSHEKIKDALSGQSQFFEWKHSRYNETLFDAEVSLNTFSIADKDYLQAIVRDVTDRKRAEEEARKSEDNYRLLFENAGEGILIAQGEKMLFANPALEEILGYPKAILTTRPFTSFIHPDDRTKVLDRHLRRMKGESLPTDYTFRIVTADGTEKWLQIKSKIVLWDGLPASLSFVENVTDRKQMEARLIQAQKLEAIGTLAGGMAHNFNNILTGIQGYASLTIMNMKPNHPSYGRLKSIEAQVKSGAELTQQLLGIARGGQYETKVLDINEVISQSATLFGKAKKEIVMHMSLAEGSLTVLADQNQMEQVFLNLFMNAAQAMPSGGNINLETRRVLLSNADVQPLEVAPGEHVKITVTDMGEGMDEKTRERIFEPFFTTKQTSMGTGLGLASVYGIVMGHRGFITVDSKVGHGTTFTIYLPASGQEVIQEQTASSEIFTGTEAILVVDDEQVVLEVSKEFLESLGYRVYGAGSGQEALAVYLEKQNEIDLVILDMILPGLSGEDTFDRLRLINPDIRVLLSSGYSISGKAQQILDRGCKGFLQKPFHLAKLSQKVREALDGLNVEKLQG